MATANPSTPPMRPTDYRLMRAAMRSNLLYNHYLPIPSTKRPALDAPRHRWLSQ